MENINLVIGNNIKALRKANKLTQNELAEKINYSNKAVSRWESGEVIPDIQTLNNICEIFNFPLSKMFEKNFEPQKAKHKHKLKIGNKLAISLLGILSVWLLATILYVTLLQTLDKSIWQIFIFAVPLSCVVGIIFNSIWGKNYLNFLLITTLIWSSLVSIYLIFLQYNIWVIFLIGIPLQIGILLWANITSNIKEKRKKKKEELQQDN